MCLGAHIINERVERLSQIPQQVFDAYARASLNKTRTYRADCCPLFDIITNILCMFAI